MKIRLPANLALIDALLVEVIEELTASKVIKTTASEIAQLIGP